MDAKLSVWTADYNGIIKVDEGINRKSVLQFFISSLSFDAFNTSSEKRMGSEGGGNQIRFNRRRAKGKHEV